MRPRNLCRKAWDGRRDLKCRPPLFLKGPLGTEVVADRERLIETQRAIEDEGFRQIAEETLM